MSTQTTQQLLAKQNEMITELITITRDCVQACHLVIQTGKMNEIRREVQPLVNPQPATFSRPELHLNPQAVARMRKAEDLFHQGKTRTQIAADLSVPYSTACLLVRGYAGRSKGVHRRDGKPKEWHAKALELYKQGLNATEISAQLMVEYNTAYQWLRNNADYKPKKRRMGRITA